MWREHGTSRKPMVVREVVPVTRDGVDYNALVVPEWLFSLLKCRRFDGRRVLSVIVPTLTDGDALPLALTTEAQDDFIEIYAPRRYTNATTDRVYPYAGARKLISFRLWLNERNERVLVLGAVHEVCALHG